MVIRAAEDAGQSPGTLREKNRIRQELRGTISKLAGVGLKSNADYSRQMSPKAVCFFPI